MSNALMQVAGRLKVSEQELESIVMNTVMPNGGRQVTTDQFVSFLAVANEYKLNPLVKEIYAFPAKGGGIQPIVSIDGWLKIINQQVQFDGMEHEDIIVDGKLFAIKCSIFRKDTKRPVSVTEYMSECSRNTDTWKQYPSRMLRHKATIQAGRYAFGISGIIDPDEADRFTDAGVIEKEVNENVVSIEQSKYISEQQAQELEAMASDNERLIKMILGAYKITSLVELKTSDFEQCKARITSFLEKANANN